jgi:DNA-binding response OmpR family regulator
MGKEEEKKEFYPLSVIGIDDDNDILHILRDVFRMMPDTRFAGFTDPELAFESIDEAEYEMVVVDWKMPVISGLAFLNRLRSLSQYQMVPVVVITGYLDPKNSRILTDIPFVKVVQKPFLPAELRDVLSEMNLQHKWYAEQTKKIERAFTNLSENGSQGVYTVRKLISQTESPGFLALAAGRILSDKELYSDAEEIFKEILRKDRENLPAITELSKILILSGRVVQAREILRDAVKVSPDNLARLLLLSDAELRTEGPETALNTLARAESIDPTNEEVINHKRVTQNVLEFGKHNNDLTIPDGFASLLNSIGISFVKDGDIDKGIEHYKSASDYVKDPDSKSKLAFNVGLGYMRQKDFASSHEWMTKSLYLGKTFDKAEKFIEKLAPYALEQKKMLIIPEDADEEFEATSHPVMSPDDIDAEIGDGFFDEVPDFGSMADADDAFGFSSDEKSPVTTEIETEVETEVEPEVETEVETVVAIVDNVPDVYADYDDDEMPPVETLTDDLVTAVPESEAWVKLMNKDGKPLEAPVRRLLAYQRKFGSESVGMAINTAIQNKTLDPLDVLTLLTNSTKSAS